MSFTKVMWVKKEGKLKSYLPRRCHNPRQVLPSTRSHKSQSELGRPLTDFKDLAPKAHVGGLHRQCFSTLSYLTESCLIYPMSKTCAQQPSSCFPVTQFHSASLAVPLTPSRQRAFHSHERRTEQMIDAPANRITELCPSARVESQHVS